MDIENGTCIPIGMLLSSGLALFAKPKSVIRERNTIFWGNNCLFLFNIQHGPTRLFVLFMSCVCHAFTSIHCCLVVTCWERADLSALVCDV